MNNDMGGSVHVATSPVTSGNTGVSNFWRCLNARVPIVTAQALEQNLCLVCVLVNPFPHFRHIAVMPREMYAVILSYIRLLWCSFTASEHFLPMCLLAILRRVSSLTG